MPYDPLLASVNYSPQAKALIKDLLTVSEEDRITASDVLIKYNAWFQSCNAIKSN